jgi:hypothetical protein
VLANLEIGAASEAVEGEEEKEGDQGAGGVEKRVPGGGGARGDEGLVNFVEAGIGGGDEPGGGGPRPAPVGAAGADAAIEKNEEDEVFGEVGAFADEEMEVVDGVGGERGQEPAENGFDDGAGVEGREGVRGEKEDEKGPEDGGKPGTKPGGKKGFGRDAIADFVEIGGGARIAPGFGGGHGSRSGAWIL